MPKKQTKQKQTAKSSSASYSLASHPSTWIITILTIALIFVSAFGIYGIRRAEQLSKTDLETAKLEVFDEIAGRFIRDTDITDNGISEAYHMTGYGISDEDGVFYITFEFADPAAVTVTTGEDGELVTEGELQVRHGIVYIGKDAEHGGYYYAYSYPDSADDHPAGIYVKK